MASFQRKSFGRNRGQRGRGGFQRRNPEGPPEEVTVVGEYVHDCEGDLVVRASISKIPYLNAQIYLENKIAFGKVDEIFGPVNQYLFSVKLFEGYHSSSFKQNQQVYIDPNKLLPLSRFLPAISAPFKKKEQNQDFSFKNQERPRNSSFNRGGSGRGGFRGGRRGRFGGQRSNYRSRG